MVHLTVIDSVALSGSVFVEPAAPEVHDCVVVYKCLQRSVLSLRASPPGEAAFIGESYCIKVVAFFGFYCKRLSRQRSELNPRRQT
jgi:hypothetical protein